MRSKFKPFVKFSDFYLWIILSQKDLQVLLIILNLDFISSFYRNAIFEDYIYDSLLDENMDDFDEDAYLERLARMKP